MATYYVDPAATGLNDGSSWTDAFTDIQSAFDLTALAAGDVVYCRGTQSVLTPRAMSKSGDITSGLIRFIGCNASGENDGTRFVLDGTGGSGNGINIAASYLWFENFEIRNFTDNALSRSGTSSGFLFVNGLVHNCSYGIYGSGGWPGMTLFRCTFYNCNYGVYNDSQTLIAFCDFHGNTYALRYGAHIIYQSIFYDNVQYYANCGSFAALNSVFDGASHSTMAGIRFSSSGNLARMLCCRLTNAAFGAYDANSRPQVFAFNVFDGNAADILNASLVQQIAINGANTNVFNPGDTNQGYVSLTPGAKDYNLRSDASLRRVPVSFAK